MRLLFTAFSVYSFYYLIIIIFNKFHLIAEAKPLLLHCPLVSLSHFPPLDCMCVNRYNTRHSFDTIKFINYPPNVTYKTPKTTICGHYRHRS